MERERERETNCHYHPSKAPPLGTVVPLLCHAFRASRQATGDVPKPSPPAAAFAKSSGDGGGGGGFAQHVRVYCRQSVLLPSLALTMLYCTVLHIL